MPAEMQGSWLDALWQVFLHADTVSSPTVVFFAAGMPIPAASLGRAREEGAEPTARGRFAADGGGKETFEAGSSNFCWDRNKSSTRAGWPSPGSALQLCPLHRPGPEFLLLTLEGC